MGNKLKKISFILSAIFLAVLLILYLVNVVFISKVDDTEHDTVKKEKKVEEKKVSIIDLESNSRPVGVMIDNIKAAWPQAGLDDAFLVYEIIVEGGQTRLFAIFKDKDTTTIGPVRSARHYYLDYALENDALYAHFGWSPQAERDVYSLKINNLNGMTNAGKAYWRDNNGIYAPHNAFTSIGNLESAASSLGYRTTTALDPLLNYSVDQIDLSDEEDSIVANKINIVYSYIHNTSYQYDTVGKVYNRYMSGVSHVDKFTKEQYTVKNIIVIEVNNYADPENSDKGRQTLSNVGIGKGYYITNGYAIPITWEKASRSSQTIYKNIKGEEIKVNDGNTYIQIQPINQALTFE